MRRASLVGINSSIATPGQLQGSSRRLLSGIGFAIPANLSEMVSSAIFRTVKATHVSLGSATVKSASYRGRRYQLPVHRYRASFRALLLRPPAFRRTIPSLRTTSTGCFELRFARLRACYPARQKVTLSPLFAMARPWITTATMNKEETSTASSIPVETARTNRTTRTVTTRTRIMAAMITSRTHSNGSSETGSVKTE